VRAELRLEGGSAAFALLELDAVEAAAAAELMFTVEGSTAVRPVDPAAPGLDATFGRFAASAQALLDQTARRAPMPWEAALETVLARTDGVDWWLAGSGALAVRGIIDDPRDLDLVTSEAGSTLLAERLADLLVEPVSGGGGWIAASFGRAFAGGRVEWVGAVRPSVDDGEPADFGPTAAGRLDTVRWRGHELRVPPLDLQLAVSRRRGLDDRAAAIERSLGQA
jgi:hypothetical protein